MGGQKEHHLRFTPRSVSDTVDGDVSPPGACISLSDLIWDDSTPNCLICRPASAKLIDFSTWGAAPGNIGVISAQYEVDDIVYGMVGITSGSYAGLDYPFAYDVDTGAFLVISGITTANCPTSQATTGAWTPPQFTLTGVDLVLTHIGYDGMTNFFGTLNLLTPTAPVYSGGNTTGNALPSVPSACSTFNNRTRFVCGNALYYTDTLALNMTASNQSQTLGDFTTISALAPWAVSNQENAVAQGLLAFKANAIYLITGDPTSMNLGSNLLTPSVGTAAPRSVVPTPYGVYFMAGDGIRNINFLAQVSEPDPDLALPFEYALVPSRVAAAYNSDIYRICVQNGQKSGSPQEDYWYSFRRDGWTGPHTFPYDCAVAYQNDFLVCSNSLPGAIWDSFSNQGHQGGGTSFVENGTQLAFNYTHSAMTDLDNIYANCVNVSTVEVALPASGETYNCTAQNEDGSVLSQGSITAGTNQSIWGNFTWGMANWGASTSGLKPYTIPWNSCVVFNKLSTIISGQSALGMKIGCVHHGYERLNYLLN